MRVVWLVLLGLLCAMPSWAFLTDKNIHTTPTPPPSLSAAGSTAVDPTFVTQIMRLTDSGDSSSDCGNGYSNQSALNVNNSKVRAICVVGYQRFKVWDFNAATMTRSNGRIQTNPPAGLQEYGAQWSRTTYNKMYAVGNKVLYEITIPDGASTTYTNTVIRDFSSDFTGTYITQMSVSNDNDVFAFHFVNGTVSTGYIAYKRSTNTILLNVTNEGAINEVEIDKSGRYLVALKDDPSKTLHVWDLQGTPVRTEITTEKFDHRAMGNGIVISACSSNRLCKRNLATPNSVVYLLSSGWSYSNTQDHFSMTGTDNWMLGSRYKTNAQGVTAAYDDECLEVSTTGDQAVRRHVHHQAIVVNNDYNATTKASVSQDGRFIAFTSNWGNSSGRTDVYVAQIQSAATTDLTPPQSPRGLAIQ